ncbi:hypothetical protein QTP70_032287, partial [Hemibagrus guttatus]
RNHYEDVLCLHGHFADVTQIFAALARFLISTRFRSHFKHPEGHEARAMDQVTFRSDTVLSDVHLLIPNARHLMTRLNSAEQPGSTQNRPRKGRPKKLSRRVVRQVQKVALKNRRMSAASIALEVAEVRGQLVSAQFAEDNLSKSMNYWNHVLWSDETKINLFGSDGVQHVWRRPVFLSRFKILQEEEQKEACSLSEEESHSGLDEDGDLDVARKPAETVQDRQTAHPVILSQTGGAISDDEEEEDDVMDVIKIEHTMATPLEDVGKQIWRGALLLSDFILSSPAVFRGATVLELGAGTGLASIVAASVAKTVYCTDVGADLLSMCQRNVRLNQHYTAASDERGVKVRQLDWTADDFLTDADSEFGWSEDEISDLHDNTTVIIAADVCYDDDLTDALFRTLYRISSNLRHSSTAYISIEKRLNFTLRHMDVSCEAYDRFCRCLQQITQLGEKETRFTVSPVSCSFPQFFQYERVNQLELWKVSASPFQTMSSSTTQQNRAENDAALTTDPESSSES